MARREATVAAGGGQAVRIDRLSTRKRAMFLDQLAATGDLARAAAAIGVSPHAICTLRRRDAAFAAAWREALALGYDMLDTMLLGHALNGGSVSAELALKLLAQRRGRAATKDAADGARGETGGFDAASDDTDRTIMAKLAQIEARRARAAERDA